MALKRRDVLRCASLERRCTKVAMAKTATERAALHRDRKSRGIVAVVPIEIHADWVELIECCTDLKLADYPDGDFSAIPIDVLRPAAQEFLEMAVTLALKVDD